MQKLSFSKRYGFEDASAAIQLKEINRDLKNSLWNVLTRELWQFPYFMKNGAPDSYGQQTQLALIDDFSVALWMDFFKSPIDRRPQHLGVLDREETLIEIRKFFYTARWNRVYDFIEFVVQYFETLFPAMFRRLVNQFNMILTREMSGYRFIDSLLVPVSDPLEVKTLTDALADNDFVHVTTHLSRALGLLSNRESPDYRNSIKESISAVESMAKIFTNDSGANLSKVLNKLTADQKISPLLRDGFKALYSYTSASDGIRHALMDEPNLSQDEAKYFLLICTSFTNYLKAQMAKQPTTA